MTPELTAAIKVLIEGVLWDEHRSGGLLSRETLRKASLLLVLLSEAERASRANVVPLQPS
jgi:hypothetical protein